VLWRGWMYDGSWRKCPVLQAPGTSSLPMNETHLIPFANFEALLCDMDGVITQTAVVHAAAWKRLFDEYLTTLAARTGSHHVLFNLEEDYRVYVDGKPRSDGIASFLASRGLALPWGSPDDPVDRETISGLAKKKDTY